jgi:hypothetical protein
MGLIPTTLGTRPRLAVEIRPEGVVAARAEDAQAIVSAVAKAAPHGGTAVPVLAGDSVTTAAQAGRRETIAAVKKALEAVALKERQTTLVLPDAAVRVLLLEFEQLPAKPAEALAVVRFRLKKLLPFDADDAAVSYQVMSSGKSVVRVLAVAVPKEVLAEYEALVREAGFEPGAVMPSTLAACAGLPEMDVDYDGDCAGRRLAAAPDGGSGDERLAGASGGVAAAAGFGRGVCAGVAVGGSRDDCRRVGAAAAVERVWPDRRSPGQRASGVRGAAAGGAD